MYVVLVATMEYNVDLFQLEMGNFVDFQDNGESGGKQNYKIFGIYFGLFVGLLKTPQERNYEHFAKLRKATNIV